MIAAEKIAYRLDSDTGVLVRESFDPDSFGYRDTSEEALVALFRGAKDLSSGSAELRAAIKDWPTEYHLSIARTNLLRGFDLTRFSSVLEIGCGCGAITRQLGEQGLSVTALDGSLARATATRARCRDLANVEVVCDNFQSFEDDRRYDLVTLIGVLEYAPMFIDGDDPFERMLLRAKSFLKPGGVLVIAIENLLGLKYFAGHEEDHIGKPYWGIQGLYQPGAARTLGRVEMDALLVRAGFRSNRYFYPFPDYKLPNAVLSEEGVRHPGFKPVDIIAAHDARSYNSAVNLTFDEALVWNSLAANQLLPHMANSFIIWCASGENNQNHDFVPWLAKNFSISEVDQTVSTTTFVAQVDTTVLVHKTREQFSNSRLSVPTSDERYVSGENLLFKIRRAMAARVSLEHLAVEFMPWLTLLQQNRAVVTGEWTDWKLPREFFDCVPHNIILTNESPSFIDREPFSNMGDVIDFSWVVIRGFLLTLGKSSDYGILEGMRADQALKALCASFGFEDFDSACKRALECERIAIFGPDSEPDRPFFFKSLFESELGNRVDHFHRLYEESARQSREYKTERDQAIRLLSQRVASLSELQVAFGSLNRLYAEREVELQEFRQSLFSHPLLRRVERRLRKVLGRSSRS